MFMVPTFSCKFKLGFHHLLKYRKQASAYQVSSFFLTLFLCLVLTSCDEGNNFAPVTDLSGIEQVPPSGVHRVIQGETLYEVAWRYGFDYRYLANLNQIPAPYTIYTHQIIYLRSTALTTIKPSTLTGVAQKPILKNTTKVNDKINKAPFVNKNITYQRVLEPNYTMSKWTWPAQGKVIAYFSSTNKGINIASRKGEPIYAIGPGKIVYAGSGLRSYGYLIIIKHNSLYLSAYAHNQHVFVKEGDWVKQGQKIAEMGSTGTNKTMLHFEIRRAGKPINPMSLRFLRS